MIRIKRGTFATIRNLATGQEARFLCHEVTPYKGHAVVFGESARADVHVVIGLRDVSHRRVCFPILNASDEHIVEFIGKLNGHPLTLWSDEGEGMYLVNHPSPDIGPGGQQERTREKMIEAARGLIDRWLKFEPRGSWPDWYVTLRLNQSGLNRSALEIPRGRQVIQSLREVQRPGAPRPVILRKESSVSSQKRLRKGLSRAE